MRAEVVNGGGGWVIAAQRSPLLCSLGNTRTRRVVATSSSTDVAVFGLLTPRKNVPLHTKERKCIFMVVFEI